jgi:hypothetical protein
MRRVHVLALLVLVACAGAPPPPETVEGLEAVLAGNPSQLERMQAEERLAVLLAERARTSHALADIDAYLARFPKGEAVKELRAARTDLAYIRAEAENTRASWEAFLAENPDADAASRKRAQGYLDVATYGGITIGTVTVEPWNLADDPKGPKNGWKFTVEVRNGGDRAIEYLPVSVQLLGKDGASRAVQPGVVVGKAGPGGLPIEEVYQAPLAPGKARTYVHTTGEIPEGWTQQVRVVATAMRAVATK